MHKKLACIMYGIKLNLIMSETKFEHFFNFKKTISAIDYLFDISGADSLNYTNIIKWLYLSDTNSLKKYGFLITGDLFYALANGPIVSKTLDLVNKKYGKVYNEVEQNKWDELFQKNGYNLQRRKKLEFSYLIPKEKKLLESIYNEFKDYDFGAMINWCHDNVKEWNEVYPKKYNTSVPIPIETVLKSQGKTEEEIDYIIKELSHFNYVDRTANECW